MAFQCGFSSTEGRDRGSRGPLALSALSASVPVTVAATVPTGRRAKGPTLVRRRPSLVVVVVTHAWIEDASAKQGATAAPLRIAGRSGRNTGVRPGHEAWVGKISWKRASIWTNSSQFRSLKNTSETAFQMPSNCRCLAVVRVVNVTRRKFTSETLQAQDVGNVTTATENQRRLRDRPPSLQAGPKKKTKIREGFGGPLGRAITGQSILLQSSHAVECVVLSCLLTTVATSP